MVISIIIIICIDFLQPSSTRRGTSGMEDCAICFARLPTNVSQILTLYKYNNMTQI